MAITVNTNIFSLAAQRNISRSQLNLQTAVQRLSSGLRINMAKDDAAGLAVASYAEMHGRGAEVAQRTIGDGISYLGVADNALRTVNELLQRMRELAVQYANGTYNTTQKGYMSIEFSQLETEAGSILGRAKFNGATIFGAGAKTIVAGPDGSTISITVASPTVSGSSIGTLSTVETAIDNVNTELADIGAFQSRLEKALTTAMAVEEAQWSAYGRIMDADMARETARLTSAQVVQQAGVAALAQANTLPQLALGLLG
ncbi:MAG: flagellin [Sedimenticola sp.]